MMVARRLSGPGATARKYDVLTVVAMAGLRGHAMTAAIALRLISVITARYNWALDEVSIGHDELMRLWGVSRRTVVRDVEKLRAAGLLVLVRPARRGRVAAYRLGHDHLVTLAEPLRDAMAPGLAARLSPAEEAAPAVSGVVVAFARPETDAGGGGLRAALRGTLADAVPEAALVRWFDPLRLEATGDAVSLHAPSAFHADYVERTLGDRLRRAALALGIVRVTMATGRS